MDVTLEDLCTHLSEPVGGCVQGLGHGDAQQVVEEAGERAPGGVRVAAQAVQEHIPARMAIC